MDALTLAIQKVTNLLIVAPLITLNKVSTISEPIDLNVKMQVLYMYRLFNLQLFLWLNISKSFSFGPRKICTGTICRYNFHEENLLFVLLLSLQLKEICREHLAYSSIVISFASSCLSVEASA